MHACCSEHITPLQSHTTIHPAIQQVLCVPAATAVHSLLLHPRVPRQCCHTLQVSHSPPTLPPNPSRWIHTHTHTQRLTAHTVYHPSWQSKAIYQPLWYSHIRCRHCGRLLTAEQQLLLPCTAQRCVCTQHCCL